MLSVKLLHETFETYLKITVCWNLQAAHNHCFHWASGGCATCSWVSSIIITTWLHAWNGPINALEIRERIKEVSFTTLFLSFCYFGSINAVGYNVVAATELHVKSKLDTWIWNKSSMMWHCQFNYHIVLLWAKPWRVGDHALLIVRDEPKRRGFADFKHKQSDMSQQRLVRPVPITTQLLIVSIKTFLLLQNILFYNVLTIKKHGSCP